MLGIRKTLMLVALATGMGLACGKGDVVSKAPAMDASPVLAYRPLVGTWSGALYLSSVGIVSGVVNIDTRGRGSYFATVSGVQQRGQLQIEALTATHVRASAMGQTWSAPIVVEGNRLRLEVAGIGEVVLTREP